MMILDAGWTIQLFKVPSRHKNLVSRKNIHKMPMMLAAADVKRQNEKRTTDGQTIWRTPNSTMPLLLHTIHEFNELYAAKHSLSSSQKVRHYSQAAAAA